MVLTSFLSSIGGGNECGFKSPFSGCQSSVPDATLSVQKSAEIEDYARAQLIYKLGVRKLTTFYLIRHGETIWNKEHRLQGWLDSPLSEDGILHAEKLRDHLKMLFYSSI